MDLPSRKAQWRWQRSLVHAIWYHSLICAARGTGWPAGDDPPIPWFDRWHFVALGEFDSISVLDRWLSGMLDAKQLRRACEWWLVWGGGLVRWFVCVQTIWIVFRDQLCSFKLSLLVTNPKCESSISSSMMARLFPCHLSCPSTPPCLSAPAVQYPSPSQPSMLLTCLLMITAHLHPLLRFVTHS